MTIRAFLAKPRSGLVVAIALGLIVAILLTGGLILKLGWARTWLLIGFPGIALPPFFDLHVVLISGADCAQPGNVYPYIGAPCKPWGRFNYPPVWLLLGRLGITGAHTSLVALLIEFPAILLMIFIMRGRSILMGLLSLLMILSPSVILGFERGNVDIVEWALVCAAGLMFQEYSWVRAFAAFVLLAIGIVLKFLPAFCCTLFIRLRSTSVALAIAIVLFTVGYIYILSDVMAVIRRTTPISPFVSYGYPIIFDRIEKLYAPSLGLNLTGLSASYIPLLTVALVVIAAVVIALHRWGRKSSVGRISESSAGVLFLFGAGVFGGTFLLGTNYTYRLMFLLLCIPQITDWIEPKPNATWDAASRPLSYAIFFSCVVSMWLKFHPELTLHINQLADWILFGIFTYVLALNGLAALSNVPQNSRIRHYFERAMSR